MVLYRKYKKRGENIRELLVTFVLLAALLFDLVSFKIPNWTILFGVSIGVLYMCRDGTPVRFLLGLLFPIVLLFPLFFIRALGAGDIKLFSVIGSVYGIHFMIPFIVTALFFGAVVSIIHIAIRGNLIIRLQYFISYISHCFKKKAIEVYYKPERDGRGAVIHFSSAIFLSFLYYVWKGI